MNTLIYLIAAATSATLAARTWAADRTDPVHRSFALMAGLAALTWGSFVVHLLPLVTPVRAVYAVSGAFLPVALLAFIDRVFTPPGRPLDPTVARLAAATTGIVSVYFAAEIVFFDGFQRLSISDVVLALYTLGSFGVAGARLWDVHRQSEQRVQRARLRLLVGLVGAAILSTSIEQLVRLVAGPSELSGLPSSFVYQGAAPPIGAVLGATAIYALHQVVHLQRLLDLTEVVARLAALAVAASLLLLTMGVTMAWSDALAEYPLHIAFQMFLASAIFLSVYDPLRARIEAWTGDTFNRQSHLLERTLSEVDAALSRVIRLDDLGDELLGRVQASGRAPLASLYLWDHEGGAFRLTLTRGPVSRPLVRAIVGSPFTDGFQAGQRAYLRQELERTVSRALRGHEEAAARLRILDAMDADLTMPIHSGETLLGWLNLKSAAWTGGFSQDEVRRLLRTLDRAAVILENIDAVQALQEQQRLAALGTMAAGLAHEIRNPLAGIKGAAQYLHTTDGVPDAADLDEFLGVIVEETDRLAGVVEQFLDYARPLQVHAVATDLRTVVERAVRLSQPPNSTQDTVTVDIPSDISPILCDPDKIQQVLLNLLRNAREAVGTSGRVTVAVRNGSLLGPGTTAEDAVELWVEDSGPGLSREAVDKLFIPFFTTKRSGTGLGLPISRRLVEAHGGEITARSRPGHGTRVTVRLPRAAPGLSPPTEQAQAASP